MHSLLIHPSYFFQSFAIASHLRLCQRRSGTARNGSAVAKLLVPRFLTNAATQIENLLFSIDLFRQKHRWMLILNLSFCRVGLFKLHAVLTTLFKMPVCHRRRDNSITLKSEANQIGYRIL